MNKPETPKAPAPAHATPAPAAAAVVAPEEPTRAERRAAANKERTHRFKLEEDCETVLDVIRVKNPDGSGKSLDQIQAEVKGLSDKEVQAALDAMPDGLVEMAVDASRGVLVWLPVPMAPIRPVVIPAPVEV